MESTGIIRRIDDLGRVVIPREIRRSLHICEGDPLEIIVKDGCVCFRKYAVADCFLNQIQQLTDDINEDDDLPREVKENVREALRSAYTALKSTYIPT